MVLIAKIVVRIIALNPVWTVWTQSWSLDIIIITSLPKVIWEEGRVAALSHTYAVKSPLVTLVRDKFAPKSTPFLWTDPKTPLFASFLGPYDL